MSEVFPSIIFQLGVGGIGGFILGFTLKKLSKLILLLIGLFIVVLLYLGMKGIIHVSINYEALFEAVSNFFHWAGSAISWLVSVVALLPFFGSFVAGFILGLKLG
ncbi:MAG: FUN14 domain-containing protein [Candidatus Bathyarchaeia archaeon]